jgi:acyl-CoA synthetase (AMP-forming)/AMP-acid ligase II
MKDIFTSQEIVLLTSTKFAAREYLDKNENKTSPDKLNKLAEACWNGMIPAMLPELFDDANDKRRIMWQLEEYDRCLYARLGEDSQMPDAGFSLDPYVLFENRNEN